MEHRAFFFFFFFFNASKVKTAHTTPTLWMIQNVHA
jgi:hypothetical protein